MKMRTVLIALSAITLFSSCESLLAGMAAASQQQSMYSNYWNNAGTYSGGNTPNSSTIRSSRKQVSCSTCGGQGFTKSTLTASGKVRCGSCHGKGYVISYE